MVSRILVIAFLIASLVTAAIAADKTYYSYPDAVSIKPATRFLAFDNDSGSRNVTGSRFDATYTRKSGFSQYSANRAAEPKPAVTSVFGRTGAIVPGFIDYSAAHIRYKNPTYPTVAAALDQLLYVAPGSPVVSGGGAYETGQTISSVVLNWTIALGSKALTTQSIDNGIGSLSTALRTYTHSGQSITSNRTYTVSISDGTTQRTGSTTVAFSRYRHWGASTIPLASITSANILALGSSEFSTSRNKAITYDCSGGKYPTFAYVSTGGTMTGTTVGGLSFSDYSYRTISHTNASGSVTNYYVYQFNSSQTGAAIAVVWN